MLNLFFSTCFNTTCSPLKATNITVPNPVNIPEEFLCDEEIICNMVQCLDVSKANDPDGTSAKMLKCTAVSIAPSIPHMFNLCIKMEKIPEGWKLLVILPISKSNFASVCAK